MRKILIFIGILVVFIFVLIAVPGVGATISNGFIAYIAIPIWNGIQTFSSMVLASPVAKYLFWIGGFCGLIGGIAISKGIFGAKVKKLVAREKAKEIPATPYQSQMSTPELYVPPKASATAQKPIEPAKEEEKPVEQT